MRTLSKTPGSPGPQVRLLPAARGDLEELQACLDASADYFLRTEGAKARKDLAMDLLAEAEADAARQVLVVRTLAPSRTVGLVDLYLHEPEPGVAHIGLLLLRREERGRGLGRLVVETLLRTLLEDGFFALRASVGDENPEGLGFWERLGFSPAGRLDRGITVLERPL